MYVLLLFVKKTEAKHQTEKRKVQSGENCKRIIRQFPWQSRIVLQCHENLLGKRLQSFDFHGGTKKCFSVKGASRENSR